MRQPVYMLAIDHRWQWVEWCDANQVDHSRIPAAKELAAEAFLVSRERSEAVRQSGALLVDVTYGRTAFDTARQAGAVVGTPAERAGAFPLEWTDTFEQALPGAFVKVLVRHGSDVAPVIVSKQRDQLLDLQRWCAAAGKTFVLEVLVAPAAGEESDFDAAGRPQLLAAYIRESYGLGLMPDFWKIEGMPNRESLQVVDAAIRLVEGPRQLILGKGAGMDAVRTWFGAAAGATTAAGFAIGRTVYFEPASNWLRGRSSREAAVEQIAENYEAVIAAWESSHSTVS
jgi:5-dehydro-2-deoxygluconokinase